LVPYDGSKNAYRAFEYALDIAKKYNSKILVASYILVQEQLIELISSQVILESSSFRNSQT